MIDDIMLIFDKNFGRLNNLLDLYTTIKTGKKGRKTIHALDLLRATTVLMHSTLEDYLRSLLLWKLPYSTKDKINRVPLFGTSETGRSTKFELADLVIHKGRTIDEIIDLSIKEYLGKVSFNDAADIAIHLSTISINITDEMRKLFPTLNGMIKRRHDIVHKADREDIAGKGHHGIKSISFLQVQKWKVTIDKFVLEMNKNFY